MGFMQVKVGLENVSASVARREVELLVDTGALYSMVPAKLLRELGVEPREKLTFELADGRTMECAVGEARFYYDGRTAISRIIFGEEGDAGPVPEGYGAGVLGVVTLEELGLEVDPIRHQIRPTRLILY